MVNCINTSLQDGRNLSTSHRTCTFSRPFNTLQMELLLCSRSYSVLARRTSVGAKGVVGTACYAVTPQVWRTLYQVV